ncbi:o-succinylbenzoate synthase [Aerosakkonema sp. BLCC-F183]|uniref:o-succinylbenzoate synthase n=1 Tax=Aerosakkonema sp. BLCC-F183 TaxID=3342834 RepID=UPI0035B9A22E
MFYQFEFRPYQRQFKRALSTSHGNWDIREGIILRLTDDKGVIAWGEIAPIPWFGSETLPSAINFCSQLGDEITTETIFSIPSELPSCQFGFESAWETSLVRQASTLPLRPDRQDAYPTRKYSYSCLLPAGEAALHQWQTLWQQGYRTFKWKINVTPIEDEIKIFAKLIQALPRSAKLRLDANAGLNWSEANEWLKMCENYSAIEFLEQPLPVEQFHAMLDLANRYSTPIALDESVATLNQLQTCYEEGWRSIFVIKPGIVGSPRLLRQFCQQHDIDVVFSSVFETAIGRQAALNLAAELSHHNRAVGFGVNHWFNEDEETWLENLWNNPH